MMTYNCVYICVYIYYTHIHTYRCNCIFKLVQVCAWSKLKLFFFFNSNNGIFLTLVFSNWPVLEKLPQWHPLSSLLHVTDSLENRLAEPEPMCVC